LVAKGAMRVASFHGHSVMKAIVDLFPDINFDKSKFLMKKDWSKTETRRKFFEKYAAKNEFDPLVAANWHKHASALMSVKGITKAISFHDNSLQNALADLFPEIEQLTITVQQNWEAPGNRRRFFESYATHNDFDPLVADNWYQQSISKIMSTKGAHAMLVFHSGSVPKALRDLFPEISINLAGFGISTFWQQKENRRKFFENYAKSKGFDPLNPEEWYDQHVSEIMEQKGAHAVVRHHNKSVSQALLDLFPGIGLIANRFAPLSKIWKKSENRRIFFEEYADINGFDPYNPENWYLQQKRKILTTKGTKTILSHHDNNLAKALIELFPDIGLDMPKLQVTLR